MLHSDKRKGVAAALLAAIALSLAPTPARAELPANLKPTLVLAMADDEAPPPIASEDLDDQEKRNKAEQARNRRKEIDELPAYKRPWFWLLTAAVVGTAVGVGIVLAKPKEQPPKACSMGLIGCFGGGR